MLNVHDHVGAERGGFLHALKIHVCARDHHARVMRLGDLHRRESYRSGA